MQEAAEKTSRVLKEPKPRVLLMAFGDNAVEFEIRFWINDPEEGVSGVRSDVFKELWRLFRENDIEIPFPQRDLRIREWPDLVAMDAKPSTRDEATDG